MEEQCANDYLEEYSQADGVEASLQTDAELKYRGYNMYRVNLVIDTKYIF